MIAFRLLEPVLDEDVFTNFILPVLSNMVSDKIANIWRNVIKVIVAYASKLKGTETGNKCVGYLKALKIDCDFDVSDLADQGLKEF